MLTLGILESIFRFVLQRCHTHLALEKTAEMGYVVESTVVTDLLDGQRCIAKQMAGDRKTMLVEIGDDGFGRMMLEEGAKCRTVHAYMLSEVIDGDVALIVATDIDLYLFQPSLGISLLWPSNLPAITADGDDAQQVNEHCQPFSISQTRHLLQTFRQSLPRPSSEHNGLYGFRKAFEVCLQLWECCCH